MGYPAKRTKTKTRRYLRDIDQVKADLTSPRHLELHKESKAPEDLPGLGRHYCIACAKWFETDVSLVQHNSGKPHKRRLKDIRNVFTHVDANAASNLRIDNGPKRIAKSEEVEMAM
ncbi:hypothetical protein B0H63DRAFT_171158 [Podospora didyma]|uniref:C2H2-type domain-containing protein n=1 Tax=Podospora didyma TaxID=330526 RepID=A0AAE0NNJ8_9PEZI|nr:hypothetical protein B0H63DRAFT_171158 [Podospora didyma]